MHREHRFESPSSRQTLAEGRAEYFAANPGLTPLREMSPAARAFFRCHDTAHVVFGCGTSLEHEAIVKLCSVFGTTAGAAVLRGYRLHESTRIHRRLPAAEVAATLLRAVVFVPRTLARCRRQTRRWPWDDFDAYEAMPLDRLRATFGIAVPRSTGAAGAP